MQELTTRAFIKAIFTSILIAGVLFLALSVKVPAKELLSPIWISVLLFIGFLATAIDTVLYMRGRKTSDLPSQPSIGNAAAGNVAFTIPKKTILVVSLVTAAIVSAPRLFEIFAS